MLEMESDTDKEVTLTLSIVSDHPMRHGTRFSAIFKVSSRSERKVGNFVSQLDKRS